MKHRKNMAFVILNGPEHYKGID